MDFPSLQQELKKHPRKWMITGAAGFIGSHLLEALLKLEQPVVGLDNFFSGSRQNLAEVERSVSSAQWARFQFIQGDIREASICCKAARGVDFVLHHAAMCSVPASMEEPMVAHDINVTGTLNLLAAAKTCGAKAFVYASSSAVYGDDPGLPKREQQIGRALSPYGLSKQANEMYAGMFSDCFGLRTIGLRYFNVYGPRQDPNGAYAAVIPKWIHSLLHGEPVSIYGDGETTRDFCHVSNVVQANLLAAIRGGKSGVYNVALGKQLSLNELFATLKELMGRHVPGVLTAQAHYHEFRPGDVRHSQADIAAIRKDLGFEPGVDFAKGLEATLQWYQSRSTTAQRY